MSINEGENFTFTKKNILKDQISIYSDILDLNVLKECPNCKSHSISAENQYCIAYWEDEQNQKHKDITNLHVVVKVAKYCTHCYRADVYEIDYNIWKGFVYLIVSGNYNNSPSKWTNVEEFSNDFRKYFYRFCSEEYSLHNEQVSVNQIIDYIKGEVKSYQSNLKCSSSGFDFNTEFIKLRDILEKYSSEVEIKIFHPEVILPPISDLPIAHDDKENSIILEIYNQAKLIRSLSPKACICLLRSVMEWILVTNDKQSIHSVNEDQKYSSIGRILNSKKDYLIHEMNMSKEMFELLEKIKDFGNAYSHAGRMIPTDQDKKRLTSMFDAVCLLAECLINHPKQVSKIKAMFIDKK